MWQVRMERMHANIDYNRFCILCVCICIVLVMIIETNTKSNIKCKNYTQTTQKNYGNNSSQYSKVQEVREDFFFLIWIWWHFKWNWWKGKSAYEFTSLFDSTKAWEMYTAESGSSLVFQHFTQVCFRVPPICTLCTPNERTADNAKITSHPWHSAV
jgi:hypothetical protein